MRNKKTGAETPAYRHPMPPPRPLPELDELSRETDSAPIYRKAMAGVVVRKRFIDANAIKYTLESSPGGWGGEPGYIATKEEIDKIPTVDAVEVVRCEACLYYEETVGKDSGKPCGYGRCIAPLHWITGIVYDDNFCSYGERRDSE